MTNQTYLMKQKQTHNIENRLVIATGMRIGGGTGHLGLADVSYYVQNGQTTRPYRKAQGSIFNILWYYFIFHYVPLIQTIVGANIKKRMCVYMYNWITLLYSRN